MNHRTLRIEMVRKRRAIRPAVARRAAGIASARAWELPVMHRARRIAAYFAVPGELDCEGLIARAWLRKRQVFLPVLSGAALFFRLYTEDSELTLNRFGIPEPADGPLLSPAQMDVVIAPLVAFDLSGNRLGMGGGFYDRSFGFLRHRRVWRHPRLVGFAYEMQRVDQLHAQSWDVPLHAVVTEHSKHEFPQK